LRGFATESVTAELAGTGTVTPAKAVSSTSGITSEHTFVRAGTAGRAPVRLCLTKVSTVAETEWLEATSAGATGVAGVPKAAFDFTVASFATTSFSVRAVAAGFFLGFKEIRED
jgi:hypothetical protein